MIKEKLNTIRQDEKAYYDALSREKFLFDQYFREKEKQELLEQKQELLKQIEELQKLNEELKHQLEEQENKQ